MTAKGLVKELATFLLLKTICESGYIFSYLKNPKCLALVKRDTLYRHVKTLIAEGLIDKHGDNLRLIGAVKIAVRYNNTRTIYLDTQKLIYDITRQRVSLSFKGQKSEVRKHNTHRTNIVRKYYRGNYVSTDSNDCPNLSLKGIANMFGLTSLTSGYRLFKLVAQDVSRIHRVEFTPTGHKYISCEIEVAPIKNARREEEKDLSLNLRTSYSYCSNDCIGW